MTKRICKMNASRMKPFSSSFSTQVQQSTFFFYFILFFVFVFVFDTTTLVLQVLLSDMEQLDMEING